MTMRRVRRRALYPSVLALEARCLLSGELGAVWIGQDRNDLVGPSSVVAPDGVQDIRIALTNLPAARSIAWAKLEGLGGGEWLHKGPWGPWAAEIVRVGASANADLFAEPYQVEVGRPFSVTLGYDDGTTAHADFPGGTADPNLRMPSASARLAWLGQDGQDRVGGGASVGPDGIQDLRLSIENLSPAIPITGIQVESSSGGRWASGLNPQGLANAEFIRRGQDAGDLYLNPQGDPRGQTFTATITYANGKLDVAQVAAGPADPALATPKPSELIPTFRLGVTARWVGQDGQDLAGPGSARLTLEGLPAGRTIVAASMSNSERGLWLYRPTNVAAFPADPWGGVLAYRPDGTKGDLSFQPDRDESTNVLTVRLGFDDGSQAVAMVVAGVTDPTRRAARPDATSIVARPGDDLNSLVSRFGTVRLGAGVYEMTKPLILTKPVALLADPNVTIRFSQPSGDPAWSTAIKIHAGNTTLDGFSVRFATPIRWADNVSYGAAVIGTTDNLDTIPGSIKTGLRIVRLDVQSPPVTGQPVEAPRLMRLISAQDGQIEDNRLKGGTTEFRGGPWIIRNNTYLGTVPNTYSWTAFAGHETHNLDLSGNTARPQGASGKTWRFLVLTGTGNSDLVAGNIVVGIGPRDTDAEDRNAAEIILTESYRIKFEGTPSRISADGRVVQIPLAQGETPRTGDMVAILSGPSAGQYRRILQALGTQTFLLDSPLPSGSFAISIAAGFVDETFRDNTIDTRGSSAAGNLILVGNHYGTTVQGNTLLGGHQAFKISASATEEPVSWGWSHSPFLGVLVADNILEDSFRGGTVSVEHSSATKSNAGRTYFSGQLLRNTVTWTSSFLLARGGSAGLQGLIVGDPGSLDPSELSLTTGGNRGVGPSGTDLPTLNIVAGKVDGVVVRSDVRSMGGVSSRGVISAPTGLTLVNDSGYNSTDRITADGRLKFVPVAGAAGYEYKLSWADAYTRVDSPSGFLPQNLTQVQNTVLVRAIDAQGNRSADSTYYFFLDNDPPITSGAFLSPATDTGVAANDRITRITTPQFGVNGDVFDTMVLVRNGQDVDSRLGPGTLRDPVARPDSVVGYSIRRIDAAGNVAISPTTFVTIDTRAPAAVGGLKVTGGVATFLPSNFEDVYEFRLSPDSAFTPIDRRTAFTVGGATRVSVRAMDVAGNYGPEIWLTVGSVTTQASPSGLWIGQDGKDFVGASPALKKNGRQDVHIQLSGLPANQRIRSVIVVGPTGRKWQYGGARGPWRAQLFQKNGSTTADLYINPDQMETGRSYEVTLRFTDGSAATFRVEGGQADPARRVLRGQANGQGGPLTQAQKIAARRATRKAALERMRLARMKNQAGGSNG